MLVEKEKFDFIVLEVEVIVIDILVELENEGYNVILIVKVIKLIMNCEGICCLVVEELGLKILFYCFVDNFDVFK